MPGIQPNSPKTFDNRKDLLVRIELLENQVRKLTSLLAVKGTASENESATSHSLEVKPDAPLDTKVHTVGEAVKEGLYMRTDGKQAAYFSEAQADEVATNAAAFTGNLSGTDTDVQKALETIDAMSVGGTGDVTGPAGATDGNLAAFDTATGKLIKDSGASPSSFEAAGTAAGLMSSHESNFDHTILMAPYMGATGSFVSNDAKIITVTNGIITAITI